MGLNLRDRLSLSKKSSKAKDAANATIAREQSGKVGNWNGTQREAIALKAQAYAEANCVSIEEVYAMLDAQASEYTDSTIEWC